MILAVVRPSEAGESVGLIVAVLWESKTLSSLPILSSSEIESITLEKGSP